MIDDSKPIFLQIAQMIESDIVDGVLAEEAQVPSTNEFAVFHRINPATAAKGVNRLVDEGILYKRRGIGMVVATGARAVLVTSWHRCWRANPVPGILVRRNRKQEHYEHTHCPSEQCL